MSPRMTLADLSGLQTGTKVILIGKGWKRLHVRLGSLVALIGVLFQTTLTFSWLADSLLILTWKLWGYSRTEEWKRFGVKLSFPSYAMMVMLLPLTAMAQVAHYQDLVIDSNGLPVPFPNI